MINRIYFARLRNVLLIQTILVFCVSAVLAQQKQPPQPYQLFKCLDTGADGQWVFREQAQTLV